MFHVMTVVLSEQTNKIRGVELCCLPGAIEHPAVMSTRKEWPFMKFATHFAVFHIYGFASLGLDCEGVSLGRWGRLCLCQAPLIHGWFRDGPCWILGSPSSHPKTCWKSGRSLLQNLQISMAGSRHVSNYVWPKCLNHSKSQIRRWPRFDSRPLGLRWALLRTWQSFLIWCERFALRLQRNSRQAMPC